MRNFSLHVPSTPSDPAWVMVRARGELDRSSELEFRQALEEAVAAEATVLLVDLGEVSFLDSAGLSVLVGVKRRLELDRDLRLCQVPRRVMRSLELSGITKLLPVQAVGDPWPWSDVADPGEHLEAI
ncbi:MAG: anti-sigma factor antagonist [Frankiaceae bacterium]|nr:anti-sigma factor antagonist [Frankiaceae bacterium]MDQ1650417.1 anti-sigma factor antagonist [Frankiaceae bacterium]MDQ1673641.1 anti-sigma factor antagonist [Frankiaceae bacterium]MDX6279364.1 anti-sigma factor antagonist [Kribbellaceae bacterium]